MLYEVITILWGFEVRERGMELYEQVSGARLHAAYFRPGGVAVDLPAGFIERAAQWCDEVSTFIVDMERMLTGNRIFRQRTVDIGVIDAEDALDWGFTGPCLRASGVPWDLRKAQPYDVYAELDFDIPVGKNGDCFA